MDSIILAITFETPPHINTYFNKAMLSDHIPIVWQCSLKLAKDV